VSNIYGTAAPSPGAARASPAAWALKSALLGLLLALAPASHGQAAPICPAATPAAMAADRIPQLLAWIEAHSRYHTNSAPLPTVSFCDPGEKIQYEGHEALVYPRLQAVYDLKARRIYLVRPWSVYDARDLSVLLHELVHYLQFQSHSWPCPQAAEWEAYHLQAAWLAEKGIDAGFDWAQIGLMSRCRRDVHP